MPRYSSHVHPCDRCGRQVPCRGELARNHDGWPETICLDYHTESRKWGLADGCLCETCRENEVDA